MIRYPPGQFGSLHLCTAGPCAEFIELPGDPDCARCGLPHDEHAIAECVYPAYRRL